MAVLANRSRIQMQTTGWTFLYAHLLASTIARPDATKQLELLKTTLRLSTSELARLIGVSRPTIYSWMEGTRPGVHHERRLGELVDAIRPRVKLFQDRVGRIGQRAIDGEQKLIDAIAGGMSANDAFARLARIFEAEDAQRRWLDEHFAGRKRRRDAEDFEALG
jgi:transcriptional regulator with XRE-family HTH domain